ncbi:arachidonate 15-lipoxygenase, type B isoform 1 [Camelus ferus]|nr:arachidonate 15-lipoxygenase, type B isoform 1 [Camelus ferus]
MAGLRVRVRVSMGEAFGAGTWNKISVSIVGTQGETPPLPLDHLGKEFTADAEEDFEVTLPQDVGSVLLLRVHKTPLALPCPLGSLAQDAWFCRWFQLMLPQGSPLRFPCYQWLEGEESLVLREGTGRGEEGAGVLGEGQREWRAKISCEDHHPRLQQQREEELQARREMYRWKTYNPGWPHCLDEETVKNLNLNIKYSVTKKANFYLQGGSLLAELKLKGLWHRKGLWKSLKEMTKVFSFWKTPAVGYVFEHWQEDAFFAYQFLNGLSPVLIQRCRCLPKNFPVTDAMVAPMLGPGTSLQAELEKGSVFLVDHGILSGVRTNVINGRPQFSAAPMTLLYQWPGCGPLLPLAIQLSQTPGPDSPIFLPTDDKWDWLLAKTWVRNAEFTFHEALAHLLMGHLIAEVFTLALLRQLPHCHPLFKLLIPHTRYTLYISTLGRELLIASRKVVDRSTGLGLEGLSELIQRHMEELNYSALCLPEDSRARGVEDIPGYYYRDDGMKIWDAVERFVSEIINNYYPSDESVRDDSELQAWVWEIFSEGFLGRESSGLPSSLRTREALIQYVTMVIFNCSAKHSAVSAGQFDFGAWMPNLPPSMQLPPPTSKGQAKLEGFLATLPPVNATCDMIIIFWMLSKEPGDQRPLGTYPDKHFTEEAPRRSIAAFQNHLAQISRDIRERNQGLELPYTYLDPPLIENTKVVWQDSHCLLYAQHQAEIKERQQKYRNIALKLKGLLDSQRPWRSLDEIHRTFIFSKSPVSGLEYMFELWQENTFFAYQFLNGLNPVLIQCCHCLPKNFPVIDAMVAPVLGPWTSLQAELELTQTPGPGSPILLPCDAAEDWLLAKTLVQYSGFLVHEIVMHLLRAHFVMEAFSLSMLRQLPLLIPHFCYTFHINIQARTGLFAAGKLVHQLALCSLQATSLGQVGCVELLAKGLKAVTYRSLCLPHHLAD